MKTLLVLPVGLLLTAPVLAQQPEAAPASDLSKLRQSYVDSLDRLLDRYVRSNDVADAAAVSRELEMMTRAPADAAPDLSPCGTWEWPGGDPITIAANGIATHPGWKTRGIWSWINEQRHEFQIAWQDGFVDRLGISPDGTKLQGTNNANIHILARRLSSSAKPTPHA